MPKPILCVGDVHSLCSAILPRVDAAIERYDVRQVVFFGDYCDQWVAGPEENVASLRLLVEWTQRRRGEGLRLSFLLGNHDSQYVLGVLGPGSTFSALEDIRELLAELKPTVAAFFGEYAMSHGGFTNAWVEKALPGCETPIEAVVRTNVLWESNDERNRALVASCGFGRGGGGLPGPLWADLSLELLHDAPAGWKQIVGHTPVRRVARASSHDGLAQEIWAVDAFSLDRGMRALGSGEMLLVDEEGACPVDVADGGAFEPWRDLEFGKSGGGLIEKLETNRPLESRKRAQRGSFDR